MSPFLAICGKALAEGVAFLYGCTVLTAAFTYAIFQREFWYSPSEEEEAHLRQASHELWSLSAENDEISHKFLRVPSGPQLHYLEPKTSSEYVKTLVILLHGFPDSGHLFSRQLQSYPFESAKLVALDLPGYGGSDSLPSYGPDQVLNAVAEGIIELKRRYLKSVPEDIARCILVGHDWGGVVGYRIAAESTGLIDEFVAVNSIYPRFAADVVMGHFSRARQLIGKRELRQARAELRPVFAQIKKSGYTYMLTLPMPLAMFFPRLSVCLVKLVHRIQYKQSLETNPAKLAKRLSSASGPGPLESKSISAEGLTYGPSVYARSLTTPLGDWDQKVRLYGDGLLRRRWTPSYDDGRDQASRLADATLPKDSSWKLKCPVSIIFGLKDIALDPRIVLDGIEEHFLAESDDPLQASILAKERITRLPDCGHWSVLEDGGVEALKKVLARICSAGQR